MSEEKKVYEMWSSNERVTKLEHELTQNDKNLMLANLIDTFNKCPDEVKLEFINRLIQEFASGEDTET